MRFLLRTVVIWALLGGLVWYLEREQQVGRFQQVDEVFEDFLIANTRARFDLNAVQPSEDVVYVGWSPADAAEFSSWPPPPLDWQMLIQQLAAWHPEVLVVTTPLNWGQPHPDFVPAVKEALLPFQSVVLAVEGELAEGAALEGGTFLGGLEERLPVFARQSGSDGAAAELRALVQPPDELLLPCGELGVTVGPETAQLYGAAVVRSDGQRVWMPLLLGQVLSRLEKAPYANQRVRLGRGAGVHVGPERFVPLTEDGRVEIAEPTSAPGVRRINGLDLMVGDLAPTLALEDRAALEKARLIVVGLMGADAPGPALAETLARIDALPRLQRLPLTAQWAVWCVAGLVGWWMVMRVRRGRALLVALGGIFAALTISYLVFESQGLWCPPTMPCAILLGAAFLTLLFGRSSQETRSEAEPTPSSPATSD
ncbi:MAG: hypothetical protein KDK99_04540 [Verrucomicrobiales bacterium]|nr:hypothetical protein [Verrucomicrobiales bacterium]